MSKKDKKFISALIIQYNLCKLAKLNNNQL